MPRRSWGRCRRRRRPSTSLRPDVSSISRATRGRATWPVIMTTHPPLWSLFSCDTCRSLIVLSVCCSSVHAAATKRRHHRAVKFRKSDCAAQDKVSVCQVCEFVLFNTVLSLLQGCQIIPDLQFYTFLCISSWARCNWCGVSSRCFCCGFVKINGFIRNIVVTW